MEIPQRTGGRNSNSDVRTSEGKERLFYESMKKENCIYYLRSLFEPLCAEDKISACLGMGNTENQGPRKRKIESDTEEDGVPAIKGLSFEVMTRIHGHLQSSDIWKKQTDWTTEVEYTIPHPDGDVSAFDTDSCGEAKLTRKKTIMEVSTVCGPYSVNIEKFQELNSDKMDMNTSRFSHVKIMSTKRFFYETQRSCWVFKLVVLWEGKTKIETEKAEKKYLVYVESGERINTLCTDPVYTTASLLEKIIDLLSIDNARRVLEIL